MIRQIRYFHEVVKQHSFSKAAFECHISQSAISQQIQTLERELGFELLIRQKRSFYLTSAGQYFYEKTLDLIADYDKIVKQAKSMSCVENEILKVGYLRSYSGNEFYKALEQFSQQYPNIHVQIVYGNHEELYRMMEENKIDMAFNDQRRYFSKSYENIILTTAQLCVELSNHSSLANAKTLDVSDLKDIPCILISSMDQRDIETNYYRDIIGFKGSYVYASNLEEARMMVVAQKGFLPIEGESDVHVHSLVRIPLLNQKEVIERNYCLFWRKENTRKSIENFAQLLKESFNL